MMEISKFDVFLSHNSKEKPAVERLAEKLKREAIEPWLDKWCLTGGGDWQDELAEGIRASSSCAVFVGPNGIGDWARLEFRLATDRMAKDRDFRVFLVLLPDLPDPFDASSLPPFLTTRTWVDLRKGVSDPRAFQQLVNAIKGLAPGPEIPIEPRNDVCPYRGLQAFDEGHAEFFFGRGGEIQRLVEKLKAARFLAVVGPSGSGKSSLVRAGLLPALRKGALSGNEELTIQVFTPGPSPLTQLAANLQRLNPQATAGKLLDELGADERALHLQAAVALAERPPAARVLWVVDQFEEVFTLCNDEAERKQFIANLLYAGLAPGGRSVILLTMRADFYQKCAAYPELSAQIIGQQFLVSPMSVEGLKEAIQEPAWRVGLEFEPGLVETILEDVESQPGALPLLEHALLELWERRRARLLTLEAYRESGGVEGAIAKRADAIYESFDAEQQSIARRVMLRLTQPGEGTEDTRRRAQMSELITNAGESDKVQGVVQAMADARLLMTDSSEDASTETVEVSHEALIRGWPRLRRWIDEDRQGLRVLRRVTEAAQEWQKANEDESLLFRGARLAQALELRERSEAALNDLERKFLTASAELRDREQHAARRRTRRVIAGLAAALILISAALIYAIIQSRIAARRGTEARARELAANATALLSADPELSLILAIEAAKTAHSPETEHTLRQALARAPLHVFKAHSASFTPDGENLLVADGKGVRIYDAKSGSLISESPEDGSMSVAAYSPDGKLIATTKGTNLRIREVSTGRIILNKENALELGQGIFSPDSNFFLSNGNDGSQVIEVKSGRIAAELEGGDPAAFSRDGKILMTASAGERTGTLFIYETNDWKLLDKVPTMISYEAIYPLGALSPDGRRIFVGRDKNVGVYDIGQKRLLPNTVRIVSEGDLDLSNEAKTPTFSPDGKLVAFNANRTLQLWDTSRPRAEVLGENQGSLSGISFSPDGRFLLVSDYMLRLYDVKSKRLLAEFGGNGGVAITGAQFSPDGKYMLTSYGDSTLGLWDLNPWRSLAEAAALAGEPSNEQRSILSADLGPGQKLFVATMRSTVGAESVIEVREPSEQRIVSEVRLPGELSMVGVLLSPDGKLIIGDGLNRTLRRLDLSSEQAVPGLKITGLPNGRFSSDGRLFLTIFSKWVRLWDTSSGKLLDEFYMESDPESAALSTNGKLILITDESGTRLLDVGSKQTMLKISGLKGQIKTFSPDDKLIVGIWDYLEVRDAATGRVVVELRGHVDEVASAAFSPDGKYVVTASGFHPAADYLQLPQVNANEVRVWDASTGNLIYEFRNFSNPVQFAKFSSDGKFVLAADEDGTIHVYACDLCVEHDELLKLAQKRRMRELTPDERARYQL